MCASQKVRTLLQRTNLRSYLGVLMLKFGLSEKHTNFEKNLPHGSEVYLVNQLMCQNHEEDFFKL